MLFFRLLPFFFLGFFLTSCANSSINPSVYDDLSRIEIDTIADRSGQLFSHEFSRLSGYDVSKASAYRLAVSITPNRDDNSVSMVVSYRLFDASGALLSSKVLSSRALIGRTDSEFGKEEAYKHTIERLSLHLASKTHQQLLLYFTHLEG